MPTAVLFPDKPFDYRNVPLWALPQLAYIRKNIHSSTILSFHAASLFEGNGAFFEIAIPGQGIYMGVIYKVNMNTPFVPSLDYVERL